MRKIYKLGKKPARKNSVKLKFANYIDYSKFPKLPETFGFTEKIDWGMLGNDMAGDCVWAGGIHETMIFTKLGHGRPARFTTRNAIDVYSKVTGYNPRDPATDQGTDMQVAASYRKKVGLMDAEGKTHRIAAYLALTPGDIQEHLMALYLFKAVGIGILFPESAMEQFDHGEVWDLVPSRNSGGHYIPLVAKDTNIKCVTWGKDQCMTDRFFQEKNDESIVYLSEEMLINRKSAEGFDYEQLLSHLQNLNPNDPVL